MGKKEEYKQKNERFLQDLRAEEGIKELEAGVLYRVLESGEGSAVPRLNSVVSVHYKGRSSTAGSSTIPGNATVRRLSG